MASPEQLLRWSEDRTGVMRVATDRDVLPGGYMAALSPVLVAWPASEISTGSTTVVLRNVNYGGNPFERITMLHSVRLSLEAVEAFSSEHALVRKLLEYMFVTRKTRPRRGSPRPAVSGST